MKTSTQFIWTVLFKG